MKKITNMTRPDVGYLIDKNKRTCCCVNEETCKSTQYRVLMLNKQFSDLLHIVDR